MSIKSLTAWSKAVKALSDNKCSLTNVDYDVEAHHLEDKSTHPELKYIVSNGIAITRRLHRAFHKWKGGFREPTSKRDFENWLKLPETKKLIRSIKGVNNKTIKQCERDDNLLIIVMLVLFAIMLVIIVNKLSFEYYSYRNIRGGYSVRF